MYIGDPQFHYRVRKRRAGRRSGISRELLGRVATPFFIILLLLAGVRWAEPNSLDPHSSLRQLGGSDPDSQAEERIKTPRTPASAPAAPSFLGNSTNQQKATRVPPMDQTLAPRASGDLKPLPEITAEAYLVMDEASGSVLVESNSRVRRAPASLVKIMTALLALERGRIDDVVEVDVDYTEMPYSTVMGLLPGERLTLRDLLYGLMLPSGNDAALAIARYIAGSDAAFVEIMNRRAQELGLADTKFTNPHGLDGRAGDQYTTAYDLALLSRVAMSNPVFREIAGTTAWKATGAKEHYEMLNKNLLLYNYDGADGVKIGFTYRAGQTLVGSVTKDGRRVYVVVLGSSQRVFDSILLLDYAFGSYTW